MLEFRVVSARLELRYCGFSAKGGDAFGSHRMSLVRPALGDPAVDAARLLRRLAFIILMMVAPVSEALSHGLLYVLLPVGAGILVIAGLLTGGEQAQNRLAGALATSVAAGVALLTCWSALSLIWTLFPGEASARLGRTLLTGGIAMLAIVFQPERTKISNIYLLPMGVAITAAATSMMILFGPVSFVEGGNPDQTLAQRCIMSLVILLWPALGALALRDRFIMAISLAALVVIALLAAFSQIALAALMAAALVYVAAMTSPERVARIAGYGVGTVMLAAPLFAALLYFLFGLAHVSGGGSMAVFSDLVVHEWPRFITGHGLDMAERGIEIGLLPPNAPSSIIFTLWYELGVIGVAGFAFLMAMVFRAAGNAPAHAAPAILAALTAGLVIAIFGTETTELWWMTLNGIAAIALALLVKAHPRPKRPPAPVADDEDETEDGFGLSRASEF